MLPEPHGLLAQIHARLDEYDLASPAAVRFLTMAPRHRDAAKAWHILAQAAIKAHDADHARTCRERAEELERLEDHDSSDIPFSVRSDWKAVSA